MRAVFFALVALCGCIERPWQDAPQRRDVDRGSLSDVLLTAVPPGLVQVGAVFGGTAELVGYRIEPAALVPRQRTRLLLVWRCRAEMDPWHIFVHLDDPAGSRIHLEHDPAGGRYPTEAWRPGDLIADALTFTPGTNPLRLFLGFYTQGENRLHLDSPGRGSDDGRDRLLAGTLTPSR